MDKDAKLFRSHMDLQSAISDRNALRSELSLLRARDSQLMDDKRKHDYSHKSQHIHQYAAAGTWKTRSGST